MGGDWVGRGRGWEGGREGGRSAVENCAGGGRPGEGLDVYQMYVYM